MVNVHLKKTDLEIVFISICISDFRSIDVIIFKCCLVLYLQTELYETLQSHPEYFKSVCELGSLHAWLPNV